MLVVIVKNRLEVTNLPTLIFFPILISGELIWNLRNNCYTFFGIFLGLAVGCLMGWAWATIIERLNKPDLFFINTGSNQTVCQRPSKQLFKCTFANPAVSKKE